MTHSILAKSFLPSTAVLEMTYACNHECIFCSCPWYATDGVFDERPELDVSEWKFAIEKLCSMGCCNLAFTGGEPLLKDGILDIMEFAAGLTVERIETHSGKLLSRRGQPKLYLLSNGKIMSDEILKLCKKFDVQLSMSMPGYKTFGEHTRGGMDAEHVLGWFRKAKAMGIATVVGVTVTKKNHFELFDILSHAFLAGADRLLVNRFMPGGRGLAHVEELTMNVDLVRTSLDVCDEVLQAANRRGSVGTELPKCVLGGKTYDKLQVGTRCSAALDFFVVGPSGFVRVCNHSPTRLVHVDNVTELKKDEYWQRFTLKDYLPRQCTDCAMAYDCDGGCREAAHVVGGRIDSMDPLVIGNLPRQPERHRQNIFT